MVDALPLRIFLASPGDMYDERLAVQACVNEHNARRNGDGVSYEVVEWDRVRGTVRRAQEAINELIAESHFMITLFKDAWGSAPGSPWGYTSGTEEEFFTGLLELGQADQPMRDLWVGFVDGSTPDQRIVELRQQLIRTHSVLFESISDLRDLKQKLAQRLVSWAALAVAKKNPRYVDLVPSSGRDVLRAANLRLRGEKLIDLGQPDAGRVALTEASVLGGPVEQLAYARHLRRAGDLNAAYSQTQKAIDFFTDSDSLYSTLAADAFSAQARILKDQGKHHDAIGRLEHALTLLISEDPDAQTMRCRIHDDLGLAYRDADDLVNARQNFDSALTIRRDAGQEIEVCQSLINLARTEIAVGDLDAASRYVDEVVATLSGTAPSGLHANSCVLAAQVRLRQGRANEGISNAEKALAINRQLANRRGEAISLLVLAQCYRSANQQADARTMAQECLALNESMGDVSGAGRARWLLDNMDAE